MSKAVMQKKALVVIDIQNDITKNYKDVINNINKAIDWAVACVKSTCYNLRKANYGVSLLSDCLTSYDKRKIDEMLHYYESKGSKIICLSDLE
ncbi:hypothetical protein FACS1894217_05850 [Clostridia bacterium]|nr:hypothetical protein FACS1894217_05850 [Clostridia bacterium]